jgi:hypothetical protein
MKGVEGGTQVAGGGEGGVAGGWDEGGRNA